MSITRNPLNFNRYQFLNRETQFETGYIDLKNRQYNPQTGQFTSQDPVIEGQEHLSLYQYGWNNPVLRPDPNGLMPCCGDFLNGVGNGFVGTFQAIGNAIAHPINTYNNAAQSSTAAFQASPVGFVADKAISSSPLNSVREGYEFGKALATGNSFGAGQMAGGKIAEVAIAAATEGAGRVVGAVGKVGVGAEVAESSVSQTSRAVPSLKDQASALKSNLNGSKNSVSVQTSNKTINYDLEGATHKGIETPHKQYSYPNTNKDGKVFMNKDRKNVDPMNQQDIRTIKKVLESRQNN